MDGLILKALKELGHPQLPWVCRDSTTGRGIRLHQIDPDSAARRGWTTYHTPLEAIEAYLKTKAST